MPAVVGLSQSAAESAITDAGLSVGTFTSTSSDTVPAGEVISQDSAAGTSVPAGSSVALVVSTGPATNGGFLEFDGANDRVVVPNAANLRLRNAVTVEAWIQPQTVSTTNVQDRVPRKGNNYELAVSTGDTGYAGGTSGHVQWRATIGGTNRRICGVSLVPGNWHHVAGTYDGTTVNLYVDGTRVATLNRSGQMATSSSALVIGNDDMGSHAFDGGIDSVAVWNRALNASELLARTSGSLAGTEENLVSYWQFDEPSGQTAFDLTSRANHGRLGTRANADNADPIRRIDASP